MGIRKAHVVVIGALAVTLSGVMVSPAMAVEGPDGTSQVLAAGGSDTTEDIMDVLADGYNNFADNADPDNAVNIPVQANTTDPAFPVPADPDCTSPNPRNYVNKTVAAPPTTWPAPNGSTDGKNALRGADVFPTDNLSTGCIDIARSSSGPAATDPTSFEYYAYALDAVTWASFDGGDAPASLSVDEIRKIYNCEITDWQDVGGQPGTIKRFIPQAGSGTRNFFIQVVLNNVQPSTACGPVPEIQENSGNLVPAGDRQDAILPYSVAQYIAQANGVVPDKRGGAFAGQQEAASGVENPVSGPDAGGKFTPNPAVIKETGGDFLGIRFVYNIIDSTMPQYEQAKNWVGFDSDGPGYICDINNSDVQDNLTLFGFQPLSQKAANGNTCVLQ